jgi:excisionase family DNA binding protein
MTTKEPAELSAQEVMQLARARADELLKRVNPRIPTETQSLLQEEMENVLRVFEDNLPALCAGPNDEVISTSEAARLLFVSRPHVVKLIEEGKLPLHHITGQNRFLLKGDVLSYKAAKQAEAKAFFETQTEDNDPPGL